MLSELLHTPITMEPITLLIWISIVVIAFLGIYLVLVLHRVLKLLRTVNTVTDFIDKFRDTKAITDKLPLKKIRQFTDLLPKNK